MILRESFDDFLRNRVNLNPTRLDRIRSAHRSVRAVLKADADLAPDYLGTFLQGSYAQGTGTRSPNGDVYDVDVVLALDLEDDWGNLPSGWSVLNDVADALDADPLYAGKIEIRDRCVRVAYSNDGMDFHLDVLPAHAPDGTKEPLQIPRDWRWTDPRGFKDWMDAKNRDGCGLLRRVIRLLKYWRSVQELGSPNSMVLTTLAGLHLPKSVSPAGAVDDALVQTMEGIAGWATDASAWSVPEIPNPSMEEENLARAWSAADWRAFRDAIRAAADNAREARGTTDEEEAVSLWNGPDLFDGTFPTTLRGLGEGHRQRSAAFVGGGLAVGGDGCVGSPSGRFVRPNRGFYGDS